MPKAIKSKPSSLLMRTSRSIYILTILLMVMMIFPVSVALSAGIASVSVVIFGLALSLTAISYFYNPASSRILALTAACAALFGLIIPQVAFLNVAQRENVSLYFDPLSYLTVSGDTTIQPKRIIKYKQLGERNLQIAYYPTDHPGNRPAVVLLHGGGWRYGSHLETGNWPRVLTTAGFHVFSVEYRLSNDTYHTWRDAPHDVHDAYSYVNANAKTLFVDPAQIHLLGQSAGGHLALLEAYLHNQARSVISLYAPIDLTFDYQTSRDKSAELDFLGGPPKQFSNRYKAVSPIVYVSPHTPRTLIVQGKTDDLVASKNATLLSESLVKNRIEHELLVLPMTGHSFENQRGGFATQITEARVLRFLSN